MGHLGCADVPADPCNETGRARFAWGLETARAAGLRPAMRHLAATAAALTDPRTHHTLCRIGAGLVGIDLRNDSAAPSADADRAGRGGTPGAGRQPRRVRALLGRAGG